MAPGKPDAPRCPACGRYMQDNWHYDGVTNFQCCGIEKTIPTEERLRLWKAREKANMMRGRDDRN